MTRTLRITATLFAALIGKTMRVKASWAGDSGNLGGHSKWTSLRLTS